MTNQQLAFLISPPSKETETVSKKIGSCLFLRQFQFLFYLVCFFNGFTAGPFKTSPL